jgi:hypothetical protein
VSPPRLPNVTNRPAGCDYCRENLNRVGEDRLSTFDCETSFRPVQDYFSANLKTCPDCGTTWLCGYYEDFTKADIVDEWGERHFVFRPLDPSEVATVKRHAGRADLEIDEVARPDENAG